MHRFEIFNVIMPLSSMASGIRNSKKLLGDEIDSRLDDLGSFSYLDGIPFELDRTIKSALEGAQMHLAKADALLAIPIPPSITDTSKDDALLADIGRIEKQVMY